MCVSLFGLAHSCNDPSLNASSIPPTNQPVAQQVEECIPTIRQVFAFNDT